MREGAKADLSHELDKCLKELQAAKEATAKATAELEEMRPKYAVAVGDADSWKKEAARLSDCLTKAQKSDEVLSAENTSLQDQADRLHEQLRQQEAQAKLAQAEGVEREKLLEEALQASRQELEALKTRLRRQHAGTKVSDVTDGNGW